jgi:hypothetical protein
LDSQSSSSERIDEVAEAVAAAASILFCILVFLTALKMFFFFSVKSYDCLTDHTLNSAMRVWRVAGGANPMWPSPASITPSRTFASASIPATTYSLKR